MFQISFVSLNFEIATVFPAASLDSRDLCVLAEMVIHLLFLKMALSWFLRGCWGLDLFRRPNHHLKLAFSYSRILNRFCFEIFQLRDL